MAEQLPETEWVGMLNTPAVFANKVYVALSNQGTVRITFAETAIPGTQAIAFRTSIVMTIGDAQNFLRALQDSLPNQATEAPAPPSGTSG